MTHGYRVGSVTVATLKEALSECVRQNVRLADVTYVGTDWSKTH